MTGRLISAAPPVFLVITRPQKPRAPACPAYRQAGGRQGSSGGEAKYHKAPEGRLKAYQKTIGREPGVFYLLNLRNAMAERPKVTKLNRMATMNAIIKTSHSKPRSIKERKPSRI